MPRHRCRSFSWLTGEGEGCWRAEPPACPLRLEPAGVARAPKEPCSPLASPQDSLGQELLMPAGPPTV